MAAGRSGVGLWLINHRWITALSVAGLGASVAVALLVARSSSRSGVHDASVTAASSALGRVLVDGRGRTLYLFGKDRHGHSACAGACARVWPPATVSGAPIAGAGVSPAKLTATRRADNRLQLVYEGHPLYTFSGDTGRGQLAGEGFLGEWFVVSPAGSAVKKPGTAVSSGGY